MRKLLSILFVLFSFSGFAQTPYVMSSGNFSEDFSDVSNWTNGFASGVGANRWGFVAVNATGTIPDGIRTTVSTATFVTGTSGGVQKGTGNIVLLSTGSTDNSSSNAIDLFLDFTGTNAGTLSFDWASVNNSTGDRNASIRVYTSTNGTTFTELTGAQVLNYTNNTLTSGSITSVSLPSAFNNSSTARIRFYNYNGTGGTTGSRPKVSLDNISVTATSEPTTSANSVNFSSVGDNSFTVNWTSGNGANRIVLAKSGSAVNSDPVDLTGYTANSVFGSGTQIGTGNYVVYSGSGNSVTVTGLTSGTTYHFAVYEFNGSGTSSNYKITSPGIGNQATTSGSPTISVAGALSDFGTIVSGNSSSEQSYAVSGTNLTSDIIISPPVGFEITTTSGSGYVANPSSVTLTQSGGTVNSTTVYVRFSPATTGTYSSTISHTSTGAITQNQSVSGFGLSAEPTVQSSILNFTSITPSSLTINWTNGNGSNRIVLLKSSGSVDGNPSDGTDYAANPAFGSGTQIGTGNYVVFAGSGSSVSVTGLSSGTTYFAAIYEFNGSSSSANYLTTSPLTGSQSTTPVTSFVTFDFAGLAGNETSANSNFNNSNLVSSTITRGSGVTAGSNGDRFNSSSWSTGAIDLTDYLEFTVSPAANKSISIYSVDINHQRSGTGPLNFEIRSSADSYSSNLSSFSIANVTTTLSNTFDVSGVSALQNLNSSVTFRIYGYGAGGAGGTWGPGDFTGNDIVVVGLINEIPVASAVTFSGTLQTGSLLTGSYSYSDAESNAEGTSTFKWYSADDISGTNEVQISGATANSYTLQGTEYNKYISFEVTPVASTGSTIGTAVKSSRQGAVTSNDPSISINGGSLDFGNIGSGESSSEQSYSVSGINLTNDIVITPPAGFEITTTSGSGYVSNPSSITLTQSAGTVSSTFIYVRFSPGSTGAFSANISHSSTGATTQNKTVSGFGISVQPSVQSSGLNFTSVANTSFTINWINGNGAERIVLVRSGSAVNSDPVDGTGYTSNPIYGSGSQIGSGNYVVYAGNGNSVTVTGLTLGTDYFIAVYEYNGSGATLNYLTPALTGSQSTTAPTYSWIGTTSDFGTSTNWSPSRSSNTVNDILIFDGSSIVTSAITGITTQTVAKLKFQNNAAVSFASASPQTITVGGGFSTDFDVQSGSSLTLNATVNFAFSASTAASIAGSLIIAAGITYNTTNSVQSVSGILTNAGTITSTSSTLTFSSGGIYQHNTGGAGAIPISTWNIGSTCEIISVGSGTPTGLDQSFNDFNWNNTAQTTGINLQGNLTTINGNFRIQSTGSSELRLTSGTTFILSIGNDLTIDADADLNLANGAGVVTINLSGNFSIGNTSTLNESSSGSGTINFVKTGTQTFSNSGTISNTINFSVENGSTVNLGTNIISGSGSVTVQNGGTLQFGSLNATDAIANQITASGGLVLNSGSTVELNGSGTQFLSTRTFSGLTISNSNNVSLNGNIVVSRLLNLTSGKMITGANTITLSNAVSDDGTNGIIRTAGYIQGTLIRSIGTTTGIRLFPIGTSSQYRGFNINLNDALDAQRDLTVYFTTASAGNISSPINDSGYFITSVDADGYWVSSLSASGGTFSFDLDLSAFNFTSIQDYTALRIIRRDDNTSDWGIDASVHSSGTGSNLNPIVHRTGFNSFGEFAVGSNFIDNSLPVELLFFKGTVKSPGVELEWETASEPGNVGFEILRSEGFGTEFKLVANFKNSESLFSKGTDGGKYKFLDQTELKESKKYWYQLVDYSLDGTIKKHQPILVEIKNGQLEFPIEFGISSIYPNPFNPTAQIGFQLKEPGDFSLELFSVTGEKIKELKKGKSKGNEIYSLEFNGKNLSSGIYLLVLSQSKNRSVSKIVLMK